MGMKHWKGAKRGTRNTSGGKKAWRGIFSGVKENMKK